MAYGGHYVNTTLPFV